MKSVLFFATILLFVSCKDAKVEPVKISGQQININPEIEKNDSIENFIKPYRDKIEAEMNEVLAFTPESMFKTDTDLNTAIGNMMADAVIEIGDPIFHERTNKNIDLALLNFGGIRSGINAGDITTRTAFNIMPFENEVVVVELSPDQTKKLIDYLVSAKIAHPFSGLKIELNSDGNLQSALVNNEQIRNDRNYFVATSDYLLKGGDNMTFFENAESVEYLNYKLRNLFIDYFKVHDTIAPIQDKRFTQRKN
ncbi:5'-nucleotidase C-terminal domain-containing protein [Psychroflexus aestuariivivens]|uniref:5'-nucleotidase C-terminal domain-containing protein n=1 Tax=Psychroflexus aestuariivivens TaxID=1795040 RepID=UPI000FDA527B|nr:5'-nucleotidase [Psychroflexus aestuariivivens]